MKLNLKATTIDKVAVHSATRELMDDSSHYVSIAEWDERLMNIRLLYEQQDWVDLALELKMIWLVAPSIIREWAQDTAVLTAIQPNLKFPAPLYQNTVLAAYYKMVTGCDADDLGLAKDDLGRYKSSLRNNVLGDPILQFVLYDNLEMFFCLKILLQGVDVIDYYPELHTSLVTEFSKVFNDPNSQPGADYMLRLLAMCKVLTPDFYQQLDPTAIVGEDPETFLSHFPNADKTLFVASIVQVVAWLKIIVADELEFGSNGLQMYKYASNQAVLPQTLIV